MKLGIWNRLAIVAGAVVTFVGPTWLTLKLNYEAVVRNETGFSDCIRDIGKPNTDLTYGLCRKIWQPPTDKLGFAEWFQAALVFAALAASVYACVWLSVWVIKWILRGRQTTT